MQTRSWVATIFLWKRFSSFTYLNITQFLVTLNDSIFRLLVAFSLIDLLGKDQSSNILFISGVLFVSPFLLFAMPAGELADKCSKKKVIAWTLVLEVLGMIYGCFAMLSCTEYNAYAALFVVALQASIFLPSKYAILPEIVSKDQLSQANGYMTLATYLAIIFGTFLASFFTQITNRNYFAVACFCTIIAVLGFFTSLQIETTAAKNPAKKIKVFFLAEVYKSLKLAKQYPHLLLTVIAGAYFLYTASFTQLNIIPFGLQSLNITDVQAGYVFLAAGLGVGIGSMAVAMLSGKTVELGLSIWGAFGTSISYIILFLFSKSLVMATLMILSLGIHGGLYIVPIDAYIQFASPDKDRGEIVAASSFLGFVGVMLAALSLGFFSNVLQISAATGYLVIGLMSLFVSIVITFFLPEYFSRLLAVTFFRAFYKISPKNQPKLDFYQSAFLFCEQLGSLNILALIFLYPRISFIRLVNKKPWFILKPIHTLLHKIHLNTASKEEFHQALDQALSKKMPLCVSLDAEDPKHLKAINEILQHPDTSKFLVQVNKSYPRAHHSSVVDFFKLFPIEVSAQFSEALKQECVVDRELLLKQLKGFKT